MESSYLNSHHVPSLEPLSDVMLGELRIYTYVYKCFAMPLSTVKYGANKINLIQFTITPTYFQSLSNVSM